MKKSQLFTIVSVFLFMLSAVLLTPGAAFANHQCTGDPIVDASNDTEANHTCTGGGGKIKTFEGVLGRITSLVNSVIPFIVGLTVFVIIWGIFLYVAKAGEEEKRAQARQFILWGVIGVFFMLSIWGFINILLNSFDLERTIAPGDIPRVPRIGGAPGADPNTNPPPDTGGKNEWEDSQIKD